MIKLRSKLYGPLGILLLVIAGVLLSGYVLYVQREMIVQQLLNVEQGERFAKAIRYRALSCESVEYSQDRFFRKITNAIEGTPQGYVPNNLVEVDPRYTHPRVGRIRVAEPVREPLERMIVDARSAGFNLHANAGFRSYETQARIYQSANPNDIITKPERAARPGYSEHQLGVAVDISGYPDNDAPSYAWLAENAPKYGFVLSYPKGFEEITEFTYEPWHWRYVGTGLAEYLSQNDILFNEQSGLFLAMNQSEFGYDYSGNSLQVFKSDGKNVESLLDSQTELLSLDYVWQLIENIGSSNGKVLTPTQSYTVRSGSRLNDQWSYVSLQGNENLSVEVLEAQDAGYLIVVHDSPSQNVEVADEVLGFCGVGTGRNTSSEEVGERV